MQQSDQQNKINNPLNNHSKYGNDHILNNHNINSKNSKKNRQILDSQVCSSFTQGSTLLQLLQLIVTIMLLRVTEAASSCSNGNMQVSLRF
jgi:hypothetical protein